MGRCSEQGQGQRLAGHPYPYTLSSQPQPSQPLAPPTARVSRAVGAAVQEDAVAHDATGVQRGLDVPKGHIGIDHGCCLACRSCTRVAGEERAVREQRQHVAALCGGMAVIVHAAAYEYIIP